MTNKQKIDFDELVFDKRNKVYGAYFLRRKYDDHLMAGLTLGVALLIGLLAIPYLSRYFGKSHPAFTEHIVPAPTFVIQPLITEPPAKKPETAPAQKARGGVQRQTLAGRTLQMTSRPDSEAPTPEELEGLQPGLNSHPGNGNNPYELPGDGEDGEDAGGKGGEGETMSRFVKLEKEPEFPGGVKAMYEFLRSNIRYPERAKQMGIEGTVYIGFVVDEYGNIRFAKVARGIGGGCDEEALRVVNKMPRWIPGRQAGHPVKVSLSLPVSYSLM